ncbi:alpha/beta hydrolase [Streptomyces canus]|uniref:alpha/beta hydrolase n=1 Tax=Streptomyces canus TaxID=58343 RepID=UPI00368CB177
MTSSAESTTEGDLGADPPARVASRVVRALGVPTSALVAEVPSPQAVVVALHGGATNSVYFDHPGHPRLSLLRTAAALGFTVLAMDRPGYGSSAAYEHEVDTPERRTDIAWAGVGALLDGRERGAGIFLWAHSAGCELAVRMAADDMRGNGALLGVELAGMGREHHPSTLGAIEAWGRDPSRARPGLRHALWHPRDAYPPDVHGGHRIGAPSPAYEGRRRGWQDDFARLAARIAVPVHLTLAEHEQVWRNGPAALADLATLFTAAPRVVAEEQAGAGHNTSVGHTAPAYHLKVLSFVEECVLGVGRGDGDE